MKKLYYREPFHSSFSIITNCDEITEALKTKYGKYISESNDTAAVDISVEQYGTHYRVICDKSERLCDDALLEIDRVIFERTAYDNRVLALHGSAVEFNGGAYIFLAPTTTGKTTLAAYLVSFGFGYLTDDCILIDRDELKVHPCTSPIHLRNGGLEALRAIGASLPEFKTVDQGEFCRHVYTPEGCVEKPIPLRQIFFINRVAKNSLSEMSAIERISALMRAPITAYEVNGEYLRFLARLGEIPCHRLNYRDMEYVKKVIEDGLRIQI